jgi:glycosyltransferase involved in cell wall biosynthesis
MAAVTILLCTLDGERFLAEQLASLEAQTLVDWNMVAADDGSRDSTLALLRQFQQKHGAGRVTIGSGPRRGFVANFLQLACREDLNSSYYAFCDQDDLWEADKLERALSVVGKGPAPAVYCSRTTLINEAGAVVGLSPAFRRPPSFQNALVQSIAGGNTFVFNEAVRNLLRHAGPDVRVPSHDWWLYLVTTACGGRVYYDLRPSVRYRLHNENEVGSNLGVQARMLRLHMLLKGRFRQWMHDNIAALQPLKPFMTDGALNALDHFERARELPLPSRLRSFRQSGIHRQTVVGNVGLAFGALVNRI